MLEQDWEDAMDSIIDDATHAVNNLIPDKALARLTEDQRSDLLVQINDALSPILREHIEPDDLAAEAADGVAYPQLIEATERADYYLMAPDRVQAFKPGETPIDNGSGYASLFAIKRLKGDR